LSNSDDLRLPLRWVAILYGRLKADLAITSGIHTAHDVVKGLMAGAQVTMMASELLQKGVRRIGQVLNELIAWLHDHEYESVTQMIGAMSQKHCPEPAAFERANYMKMLQSYRHPN
jgi:dihydroorotate dehydrogenase (fumarate)